MRFRRSLRATAIAFVAFAALFSEGSAAADDKDACATAAESAQALQRQGKLLDARQQALACTRAACPPLVKQDCDALFGSLEMTIPSLVIAARDDEGRDVVGTIVTIDGVVVDASSGRAVRLDPGVHALHVEAERRVAFDQNVVVNEGERARPIIVTLAAKDGAPRIDARKNAPPASGEVSPLVWILGTLGVVSLAGFGVFEIKAVSDATHLRHTCAPRCSQADADSVEVLSTLGFISAGAAAVFIGSAVTVWALGRGPRAASVQLGGGPAHAAVVGRF